MHALTVNGQYGKIWLIHPSVSACSAMQFPSESSTSARNPYSPIECTSVCTVPPFARTAATASFGQPGPLLGRTRIESKWFELVWDGLSARNGVLDGELTPSTWQLNRLSSELPDEGSLSLSGQWGKVPGQESRLQLQGKQLDLEKWGELLHAPVSLAGKVDLETDLQADLAPQPEQATSNWRRTLQGSLSLESKDPFWDKVGIDPLLDDWFREQTPPDLTPQTLWQAMQRGDTPFYQIRLDARAEQGKVRIEQGGASTITHLLALQGGVAAHAQVLAELGLGDAGPFAADPLRTAEAARRLGAPVVRGATVSSCSGSDALASALAGRSGAQVETMEGAAVLLACRELRVPAVQLRCVSNRCGERARGGWDLKGAVGRLHAGVRALARAYAWEGIE